MRLVCGVGCNDMKGKWCCGVRDSMTPLLSYQYKVYYLWKDMLRRCYSTKQLQRRPTYVGVRVCDRWLTFSLFIEDIKYLPNYQSWLTSKSKDEWEIDKEYWVTTKLYSPFTCGFSTKRDNVREAMSRFYSNGGVKRVSGRNGRKVMGVSIANPQDVLYFDSAADAERLGGFCNSNVSQCCNGKQKYHKGYYWYFI